MLHLNSLSSTQKTQIRNAFTIIDGESRDETITISDLKEVYSSMGIKVPTESQLKTMLTIDGVDHSEKGITFAQFLNILAKEMLRLEGKSIIYEALQVYLATTTTKQDNQKQFKDELQIDVDKLKDACCSVQIDSADGTSKLSRQSFDTLVEGFILETMDGKRIFLAAKWIDAYFE